MPEKSLAFCNQSNENILITLLKYNVVMGTFKDFEDIEVWQESRKLVRLIRSICKRKPVEKDFSFIDQITRSARSISANIAEGNDSITFPEFIKHLSYAKRSAAEVRSHLYDALDERYVSEIEFKELCELTRSICRMLASLIHYLQSLDQKTKRTFKALIQ